MRMTSIRMPRSHHPSSRSHKLATQYYATGRRKESTARVFLRPGTGAIKVNHREFNEYFPIETLRIQVKTPLLLTETAEQFDVLATVAGGGASGQAGAIRLGIARALRSEERRVGKECKSRMSPEQQEKRQPSP